MVAKNGPNHLNTVHFSLNSGNLGAILFLLFEKQTICNQPYFNLSDIQMFTIHTPTVFKKEKTKEK